MRRFLFILSLFILSGCAGLSSVPDIESTKAQSGVVDKITGDGLSAIEFTAVKNTADTADALATINEASIATLNTDNATQSELDAGLDLKVNTATFTQNSGILVGTGGSSYQEETGATLRTSIGLGTAAVKNEGAGSGLDADTVDGIEGADLSEIIAQSDCSVITSGLCVDTDDNKTYYWDGAAVVAIETGSGDMENPMTAQHDVIYGGAAGVPTRLAKVASAVLGYNTDSELIQATQMALDDSDYQLCDDVNATRQVQFVLDDITANNKRQYTCPDTDGTLSLLGRKTNTIGANTTLSAEFCYGYTHYITGAHTVTLAPAVTGMDPKFITVGTYNAKVAPAPNDKIILDGVSLDDGDVIDNDTATGDWADFSYYNADGWYAKTNAWNDEGAAPTACTLLYDPTFTATPAVDHLAIGAFDNVDFYGFLYTPASNQDVCAIDVYISSITAYNDGLGTADDYYCRIFTIDGSNQANSVMGTSSVVPGESLVASTWTSANAGLFSFAVSVSLISGTTYAITFFYDNDGNLNDDPSEERSEDDYPWIGLDDENNGGGDDTGNGAQGGRISYSWGGTMPYSIYAGIDTEDDVLIKIHTDQ